MIEQMYGGLILLALVVIPALLGILMAAFAHWVVTGEWPDIWPWRKDA